jgi:hypothetical protein
LRADVIRALQTLAKIRRQQAHLAEVPIVRAWASWLNGYRKEGTPPIEIAELYAFGEPKAARISAEVAAVVMELQHEQKAHPLLLTVWDDVTKAASEHQKVPEVRALRSDDQTVWIVAPKWEGGACRGGLVAVGTQVSGEVLVRDMDRPLLTYRVVLPERQGCGWVATGELLAAAT